MLPCRNSWVQVFYSQVAREPELILLANVIAVNNIRIISNCGI